MTTVNPLLTDASLWQNIEKQITAKLYTIDERTYPHKCLVEGHSFSIFNLYEALCYNQHFELLHHFRQTRGFEEQRYALARFTENHKTTQYKEVWQYYIAMLSKFGASFESLTVERLLQDLQLIDASTYQQFITTGSNLMKAHHQYQETTYFIGKANDILATIYIEIKQETWQAYKEAITYINAVLTDDFPKSFGITYNGESTLTLPIKTLPITSSHHFFAKVLRYPALHGALQEYSYKAMAEYHFYHDVDEEEAAMPSTFAVFGLGLTNLSYQKLVIDYMMECDGDHSPMPEYFAMAITEHYGLTPQSLPMFVASVLAVQEVAYHPIFTTAILENEENLHWLAQFMTKPFYTICSEVTQEQTAHWEEYKDMTISQILYTLFGIIHLNDFESAPFKRIPEPYRTRYQQIIKTL